MSQRPDRRQGLKPQNDLGYVSALLTDGAREVRFERMAGG